ncbi:MAG: hypothetical protein ACM30H_07465 [Clostridia bacterium]
MANSKAGLLQVAKTIFFGLLMIGRRRTWEEGGEGAHMTPAQLVAGAVIGGILVTGLLVVLVRVVLKHSGA